MVHCEEVVDQFRTSPALALVRTPRHTVETRLLETFRSSGEGSSDETVRPAETRVPGSRRGARHRHVGGAGRGGRRRPRRHRARADIPAGRRAVDRRAGRRGRTRRCPGPSTTPAAPRPRPRTRSASTGPGGADGWDSGRVRSDASTGVAYAGPALAGDHTYRVDGADLEPARPGVAVVGAQRFDTGLMPAADWSAWLAAGQRRRPGAPRLRACPRPVVRARLYVGAQGLVEPHLNGALVDPDRVLDSSVTDYAQRVLYRDFDVTRQLRRGRNVLGVMAGQGQFAGKPTFVAQLSVTTPTARPRMIAHRPDLADRRRPGDRATTSTTARAGTPASRSPAGTPPSFDASRLGDRAGRTRRSRTDRAWRWAGRSPPPTRPRAAAGRRRRAGGRRRRSTDQSEGYHSAIESTADTTKWVQVDLGSSQAVHGLDPVPGPADQRPGRATSRAPASRSATGCRSATTRLRHRDDARRPHRRRPAQPRHHAGVAAGRRQGRYVRVTATKLPAAAPSCTFRLAELGVYGAEPGAVYSRPDPAAAPTARRPPGSSRTSRR